MQSPPRTLKRGRHSAFEGRGFFQNSLEETIGTDAGIVTSAYFSRILKAEDQLVQKAGGKEVSLIVCVRWRQNGSSEWHETFCKSHLQALAEFGGQLVEGRCQITYKLVPNSSMENQRAIQMHRAFKIAADVQFKTDGKEDKNDPYFTSDSKEEFIARMQASAALSALRRKIS